MKSKNNYQTIIQKAIAEENSFNDKLGSEKIRQDTFGERMADKIAAFGGSWVFIIFFLTIMGTWIMLNLLWFKDKGFDPYPFILLNLVLSCLAALQAPVIMMSQNRQEQKDRVNAEKDYQINLKTEAEIRSLHDKIDFLVEEIMPKLMKLQREQQNELSKVNENLNQNQMS
jgi:uncharacterized membrane protein